jgi:diacylglycerol kinase family enzyme
MRVLRQKTLGAISTMPEYLIIWRNPGSTNNQRADQIITDLRAAGTFKDILVIETAHKQYEQNKKRLLEALESVQGNAWIAIAGGDGTISAAVNALQGSDASAVSLLPLPTGNSNDVATMLHRTKHISARQFSKARATPVYALSCTLTDKKGRSTVRYAVAYISFGITAQTAQTINAPTHRGQHTARSSHRARRRIHEIRRFASVLQRATPFTIQENGESKVLFERIVTNGQRMAKYFRWPVQLPDQAFRDISIDRLGPVRTLKQVVLMARGKIAGEHKTKDNIVRFECLTPVLAQFDGETLDIPAGTTVAIQHTATPLSFIALN